MKTRLFFFIIFLLTISKISLSQNRLDVADDTICGQECTISAVGVTTGNWVAYHNSIPMLPQPDFFPSNTSASATVVLPAYDDLFYLVDFVWIDDGGPINNYSTTIFFARQPNAWVGENDQIDICGECVSLEADTTGNGWASSFWIPSVPGSFGSSPMNDPYVDFCTTTANYGDTATLSGRFLWVLRNYGCTSIDTLFVSFNQVPDAYAGNDIAFCGNIATLHPNLSLEETDGYDPTGLWTVHSKPIGAIVEFSEIDSDHMNAVVSQSGIYCFIFSEINTYNTTCLSRDTIDVELVSIPVINAGEDFEVCGNCAQLSAVSDGFVGSWYGTAATFVDFTNPETEVCVASYGVKTFSWHETNQATTSSLGCSAWDEVQVSFWRNPSPDILNDVADSVTCGLHFENIRAEAPNTQIYGYWYSDSPGCVYGDINSYNTWVDVQFNGYHNFYWVETSGEGFCADTAGPLTIHFIEIPESDAGEDLLFCGFEGDLNANPSAGIGVWTTPSFENVSFEDIHNPNTHITSNILNTNSLYFPYFDLIWTENNSNGCTDNDSVRVVFARIPISDVIVIPPKCFGETATFSAVEDSLQQYFWNFNEGIIDSITSNHIGGYYENFVYWDNGESEHTGSMFAVNYWNCQSEVFAFEVLEPAIPDYGITVMSDTCFRGVGAILFNPEEECTIYWYDEDAGPELNTEVGLVGNLTADTYRSLARYTTYNNPYYQYYMDIYGTAVCTDTIDIEVFSHNLFNIDCPEDLNVTNSEGFLLSGASPSGGLFYIDGEEISYFNPEFYGDGVYELTYTYFDETTQCLGSCSFFINVNLVFSVEDEQHKQISVYPNPNNGHFTLELGNISEDYNYEIVSLSGTVVKNGIVYKNDVKSEISLDVFPGIYFVRLSNDARTLTKKMIIQ